VLSLPAAVAVWIALPRPRPVCLPALGLGRL